MTKLLNNTPYDELNQVLAQLVVGAAEVLQDNFVGAYLQGSFAIGDYSEHSDCDFIVVTRTDLVAGELAALRELHQTIYRLPLPYWPTNLEGSYAPKEILRQWSTAPRDAPGEPRDASWGDPGMSGSPARCYPFWYLNHGSNELVRSEHDNSQVVRWTLREKGVRLAGPNIGALVDPVSANQLRVEISATLDLAINSGLAMPNFALQAFWVGLFCRILHTMDTGTITSKKSAMAWAQETLDPQWQALIAQALTLRKGDAAQAQATVDPKVEVNTRAFASYCRNNADMALQKSGVAG